MRELRVITDALRFPEGPIPLSDGSVLVVEIAGQVLTRVYGDGRSEEIAQLGGGPNGAALGPDGRVYICNNGGFKWPQEQRPPFLPLGRSSDYTGGSIQAVDLSSGKIETLYRSCGDNLLKGPNDIVFDSTGNFWFTDHGHHYDRGEDLGAIYYAKADGSFISEVLFPFRHPNGIALSPDESTLYISETFAGRLWRYNVSSPGVVHAKPGTLRASDMLYQPREFQLYDSMAVEENGNICIATIRKGGIAVISPDGEELEHIPLPDSIVTNIAFGGSDCRKAYITLSGSGRLIEMTWPRKGHATLFGN